VIGFLCAIILVVADRLRPDLISLSAEDDAVAFVDRRARVLADCLDAVLMLS
jgi:hypothetical protein